MKVVDSHFHVWQLSHVPQPWIDPVDMAVLNRDFDLEGYVDASRAVMPSAGWDFAGGVLVQTIHVSHETPHLLALADSNPLVRAVVGWTDLATPHLPEILDQLSALPGGGSLVGMRHQLQEEPDSGALANPDFRRGLRFLEERGKSFDLIVRSSQLAAATEAAHEFPHLQFVLDHLGKPSIYAQSDNPASFAQWREAISELAKFPNVVIKMSGLSTESNWRTWSVPDLAPAFEHAYECFGSERVLWGSDWPVLEVSGGAKKWFDACAALTQSLSASEQAAFWHGNTERVYRTRELSR